MSSNDIIVSLDIGTSKVRAIIGELNNGTINIIGVGSADSEGIRKGAIVDIDQTVKAIRTAIDMAEQMVGIQISEVYVGINGNHIALQSSHGVVAVLNDDHEIGDEDIERVLQAARVIALPPEREIIDVVPQQFVLDRLEGIQDPRGMIGVRLEVEANIITGARTNVHNLIRCVERAGLKVAGRVLMSLASGQLILSKDEKSASVVLVDIGAGSTTISVFEQGNLKATSILPIGGELITSDIKIGLNTQMEIAEKVKLKFGCAVVDDAAGDQIFKVPKVGSNADKDYSQIDLANIIEPRVEEMFEYIHHEVLQLGYMETAASFVLTGGTASMPGVLNVAQNVLQSPVRIAVPDFIGVRDPAFTNGVGIIKYVTKGIKGKASGAMKKSATKKANAAEKPIQSLFERIKNWFSEFI